MLALTLVYLKMIKLDWTIPAIALTISGFLLIWFRSKVNFFGNRNEEKPEPSHDEELLRSIYNKLIHLLEDEEVFLNKNIKVSDFATRLNQSEKTISRAINKHSNSNFNSFINSFRVEYSKELLLSGRLDHYTIEAIAEESGFANKVTFYNAFKSDTGMSPKQFREAKQP